MWNKFFYRTFHLLLWPFKKKSLFKMHFGNKSDMYMMDLSFLVLTRGKWSCRELSERQKDQPSFPRLVTVSIVSRASISDRPTFRSVCWITRPVHLRVKWISVIKERKYFNLPLSVVVLPFIFTFVPPSFFAIVTFIHLFLQQAPKYQQLLQFACRWMKKF